MSAPRTPATPERVAQTCRAIQGLAIQNVQPLSRIAWNRWRRQTPGADIYLTGETVVRALGVAGWAEVLDHLGVGCPTVDAGAVLALLREEAARREVSLADLAVIIGRHPDSGLGESAIAGVWRRWAETGEADERTVDSQLCILGRHLSELDAMAVAA